MFCPKCGTENVDGAKFCRSCGANVSLVPQALTGELSQATDSKPEKPVTMSHAISETFIGVAFLIIAISLSRSAIGATWWFWMLIPAFALIGKGIGGFLQVKGAQQKSLPQMHQQPSFQPTYQRGESNLPPKSNTAEFITPPRSVTEHTTRHLEVEAPTKVFNDKN